LIAMAVLSFSPLPSNVFTTQRHQAFTATGISSSGISAGHQRVCLGSTAMVAGLVTAVMRKGNLLQLHGRRPLRKAAHVMATTQPEGENYVPILVKRADGSKIQVEVRPSDTVKVLKAMIAIKIGVSESFQELTASGVKMEDVCLMSEYDIEEGSQYTLTELAEDEEEVVLSTAKDGEVVKRIYISCDANFGKKIKKVTMDVSATDTIKDIKVRAYNELATQIHSLRKKEPRFFGLFIPKSPVQLENGNLRYLSRSEERLPESSTTEEAGLKGDEEMLMVDLFWTKAK